MSGNEISSYSPQNLYPQAHESDLYPPLPHAQTPPAYKASSNAFFEKIKTKALQFFSKTAKPGISNLSSNAWLQPGVKTASNLSNDFENSKTKFENLKDRIKTFFKHNLRSNRTQAHGQKQTILLDSEESYTQWINDTSEKMRQAAAAKRDIRHQIHSVVPKPPAIHSEEALKLQKFTDTAHALSPSVNLQENSIETQQKINERINECLNDPGKTTLDLSGLDLKAWPALPNYYYRVADIDIHPLGHVKQLDLRGNKDLPENPPLHYFDLYDLSTLEKFSKLPNLESTLIGDMPIDLYSAENVQRMLAEEATPLKV